MEFTPKITFKRLKKDLSLDRDRYDSWFNPNFLSVAFWRIDYFFAYTLKGPLKFPLHLAIKLTRKLFFVYNHHELISNYPHQYIDGGCFLNHHSSVICGRIGANVHINAFVTIGGNGKRHPVTDSKYPVIENDVEIGSGAIILGPIHIGAYSVIGAGARVTKDVPAQTIVIGTNEHRPHRSPISHGQAQETQKVQTQ